MYLLLLLQQPDTRIVSSIIIIIINNRALSDALYQENKKNIAYRHIEVTMLICLLMFGI